MSVKHLGVQEARRAQVEDGYTYVDVRSVPEYESGHPAGAHNVPLLHMNSETRQMLPNPDFLAVMQANYQADARLLIGCQVGGRSVDGTEHGAIRNADLTESSSVVGLNGVGAKGDIGIPLPAR